MKSVFRDDESCCNENIFVKGQTQTTFLKYSFVYDALNNLTKCYNMYFINH